jgi:hypothetical protein
VGFFKERGEIGGSHLAELCGELKHEALAAGDFVFHQGDYGDKFYVILAGRVQVLVYQNPKLAKSKQQSQSFRLKKAQQQT